MKTIAAAGLLLVGFSSCATAGRAAGTQGSTLPDFQLADTDGRVLRLSDLVGKQVIYIDFWATWCGPCAAEMPELERLHETYKTRGFTVLGISMDDPTTQGQVASFVHRSGLTFPVAVDADSRATALYNPTRSAPYGVLIDRAGKVVEQRTGFTPGDETSLEARIREHL